MGSEILLTLVVISLLITLPMLEYWSVSQS